MNAGSTICRLARAKINLDLLITGQRDDGYHLLDSLVVFAEYGDRVSVSPSERLALKISGPFADGLETETDNLVMRAARLLQETYTIEQGAEIHLVKNLPVASGIGGGSADAAAAMKALGDLWGISDMVQNMKESSLSLGADLPVCLLSETAHMRGIGEDLSPVNISFPLHLLLVNAGVSVSTAGIFAARTQRNAPFSPVRRLPEEISSLSQLIAILRAGGNDLRQDACQARPEIETTLRQVGSMDDCAFAGMSGSGATCFGIFPTLESARSSARRLAWDFPGWWVAAASVR